MNDILVDANLTELFVRELLIRYGADAVESRTVANYLIWSESRGQPVHGLYRLPTIVKRLTDGGIISPCHAEFSRLSRVAGSVDGRGGFGQHIVTMAMGHAMDLARGTGVSVVTVKNGNHIGAAGYYVNIAARNGMLAILMSNAFPTVAALGGQRPVLGTNPLAFAAPRKSGEPLIFDMGTTFRSRTQTISRAAETGHVSKGIAIDEHGNSVRDPGKLADAVMVPPGPQAFVLGIMVEILSGVLTGAGYSTQLQSFYRNTEKPGNLGQTLLCLDVDMFMSGDEFDQRLEHLIELLMSSGDMNPERPVRLPGERRWTYHRESKAAGVIPITEQVAASLEGLARPVGLSVPYP